jgi:hypothetical protein
MAALENAEMLLLDAERGDAPEVWCVLTTPSVDPDPASYGNPLRELRRELRRQFPGFEYACQVEFHTGRGARAKGGRTPHWNMLLKGVMASDIPVVRAVIERTWCRIEGASPESQHIGSIFDLSGLVNYLNKHYVTESQAPPLGWSGQRFNASRGYFGDRTRAEARKAARASRSFKRELWRAEESGLGPVDAAVAAEEALADAARRTWRVCRVEPPVVSYRRAASR